MRSVSSAGAMRTGSSAARSSRRGHRRRSAPPQRDGRCTARVVARALLLAWRRPFCGPRRLLLVPVADLIESDVDDIGLKLRRRRQWEAQPLLDVDKLNVRLTGPDDGTAPLEFGHDDLGFRPLAHHGVAQRNINRTGRAERPHNDPALNTDLDGHGAALHLTFARRLPE